MSWGAPWWLLLVPLVGLLAVVLLWSGLRHRAALAQLFRGEMLERVLPSSVRVRRTFRDLFALGSLVLLVFALAEPRFDKELRTIRASGVDIVLVVDLSRSMNATDVSPSRLERVRREIIDLAGMLEGDRVGLVVFAGGAFARMPLTQDYKALKAVVGEFDSRSFAAQGSALGAAIRVANELLSSDPREAGRAIWILSDGEIHDPQDALAAARESRDAKIVIVAMGVGEQAAPIPLPDGSLLRRGDQLVLSTPRSEVLREVARTTGGAYVQSVASDSDTRTLYVDELRGKLRAVETSSSQQETWKSAFQWPLGTGLLFALAAAWIGDGRRHWGAAAVVPWLLLGLLSSGAQAASLEQGDAYYRAGNYGEAVEVFTELSLERPTDPGVFQRLGAARYRAGDYEGAARAFSEQLRLSSDDVQARYNRGNSRYQAGHLEQALDDYEAVIDDVPDHKGAAHNRDLLRRELVARRKPPPPPSPQQDGSKNPDEGGQGDDNPKPGDSKQQGETDQGDGSDGPSDQQGQEGDPQGEGSPQQGKGEPGDQDAQGKQQGQGAQGGQGDTQDTPGDAAEPVSPDQLAKGEGDETEVPSASDASTGVGEGGPMTAAQAHRLLDGVEEGAPRIVVSGDAGGPPW